MNTTDIDYIRQHLKIFESNMDNDLGLNSLRYALAEIKDFLESNNIETEHNIVKNFMRRHRNVVMERAKELCCNGSPNSKKLSHVDELMQAFVEQGFDDDVDFQTVRTNVTKVLWSDEIFIEHFLIKIRKERPALWEQLLALLDKGV